MARTQTRALANTKPRSDFHTCPPRIVLNTTKRSSWGAYGPDIYGWPSGGGVIIRDACDLVELLYLGFEPLNLPVTRHENQDAENDFCRLLKRIGGKWWRSEKRCRDVNSEDSYQCPKQRRPNREECREVYIGWPKEGGVMVLEDDRDYIKGEVGMLRMVTNIEERSELLRGKLGAVFYEDPNEYPGFEPLGKRYLDNDKDSEEDSEEEQEKLIREYDCDVQKLELEERRKAIAEKCVCS